MLEKFCGLQVEAELEINLEMKMQMEMDMDMDMDMELKINLELELINIYAVIDGAAFLGERPNQSGGAHPNWGYKALPRKKNKKQKNLDQNKN